MLHILVGIPYCHKLSQVSVPAADLKDGSPTSCLCRTWATASSYKKRHLCRKVIDIPSLDKCQGVQLLFEKCQSLPTSVGKKLRRCCISGQNWSSVHAARLSRSALTRANCSGDALPAQLLSPCSCNQLKTNFMLRV